MVDISTHSSSSKAILVSGGARGIGRALVRYFVQQGHRVFVLDIDEEELKHTIGIHLEHIHSDQVQGRVCNLRDISDIREKVTRAAEYFGGRIDVLINNGGIAHPYWRDGKTMEDPSTIQEWQAYVETNLTAPFAVSQACIPFMKVTNEHTTPAQHIDNHQAGAGPCIIHIGSFRAHQSDPNQEGYASTKAGQLGLTHSMAASLGPLGIRVNLIAPGRIKVVHECKEADEKEENWADGVTDDDVTSHTTNRPGRPEDIAQAADYLMNAGFVTGESITVDGGATKQKNKS